MAEIDNPYNEPESVEARKAQEDPIVMYLIVRTSLGMSAGKACAQTGHCVGIMYEHFMNISMRNLDPIFNKYEIDMKEKFSDWKNDSFRKVILRAKENQWEKLKNKLECFIVRDAGLTELIPGTESVLGIWPMKKSKRPNIIRKLQTL